MSRKCIDAVTFEDAKRLLDALFLARAVVVTDVDGRVRVGEVVLDLLPVDNGWSLAVATRDPDLFTDISIILEKGTKTELRSIEDKGCACESSEHGSVCICVNMDLLDLLAVLMEELGITFVYLHPSTEPITEGVVAIQNKERRPRTAEELLKTLVGIAMAKLVHDCMKESEIM